MIIMGLWDRSRYGWFLHNGRPVTGSPETIRDYCRTHAIPMGLVMREFLLEDMNGGSVTTDPNSVTLGGIELSPQERELVGVVPVAERPCDSCGRWMIHENDCQRLQFVRIQTSGPFCIICGAHHPPTEDHGGYVQPIRP
jgi:hypothetical protein